MTKLDRLLLDILQCVLLIFLYVYLFFSKNDIVLIVSFFYCLFYGFQAISNRNSVTLTNNSTVIFLLFLFLYGVFNCVISYFLNGEIAKSIYTASVIYASAMPAFILGVLLCKPSDYASDYMKRNASAQVNSSYVVFVFLMLFLLLTYKSFSFYRQGILFNYSLAQSVSRLDLFQEISQVDILVGLLINSCFLFFIYYLPALKRRFIVIIALFFLYFVAMNMALGNRRDFAPMIIGVFWVASSRFRIKFSLKWFLLLVLGIFLFLVLGSLRGPGVTENYVDLISETLESNEFVYPFFTLARPVEDYLNGNFDFLYGTSIFLYPFFFFIPRSIFSGKPYSLASQFVLDYYGGGMGYAYTPVSEAFLNFGPLGPVFLYFLIGLIIATYQFKSDQRFIFVFFAMIPDLCRGEISTFVYQYFFVTMFLIILPLIFKYLLDINLITNKKEVLNKYHYT